MISRILFSRFVHYKSPSKTKKFIRYNQLVWWSSHVLAWLVYGSTIYANHGEDSGFAKFFPFALACVTFGPMLAAIHWSYSINPRYNKSPRDLVENEDSRLNLILVLVWHLFTAVTRMVTLGLLIYIYYEHWKEVQVVSPNLRLALVETVPYLILILLVNISVQFAVGRRSFWRGMLAILMPNGYYSKPQCAPAYIVSNILANFALYSVLYLVLTFYCWECTKALSLSKLMAGFPVVAVMWLFNFALTITIWVTVIRKNTQKQLGHEQTEEGKANQVTTDDESQHLGNNKTNSDNFNSWTSRGSVNTPL